MWENVLPLNNSSFREIYLGSLFPNWSVVCPSRNYLVPKVDAPAMKSLNEVIRDEDMFRQSFDVVTTQYCMVTRAQVPSQHIYKISLNFEETFLDRRASSSPYVSASHPNFKVDIVQVFTIDDVTPDTSSKNPRQVDLRSRACPNRRRSRMPHPSMDFGRDMWRSFIKWNFCRCFMPDHIKMAVILSNFLIMTVGR